MKHVSEQEPIHLDEIRGMVAGGFGDFVKAVVDLARGVDDPAIWTQIATLATRLVQR